MIIGARGPSSRYLKKGHDRGDKRKDGDPLAGEVAMKGGRAKTGERGRAGVVEARSASGPRLHLGTRPGPPLREWPRHPQGPQTSGARSPPPRQAVRSTKAPPWLPALHFPRRLHSASPDVFTDTDL